MEMQQMPKEMVENVCSYLGGYSYVANLVPYLRSCIEGANKEDFLVEVYKRQDFAFIRKYNLFPTYKVVEECVSLVVREENIIILSWLFEKSQGKLLKMIAEKAALAGSYPIFVWARHKGCPISDEMFYNVAKSGNIRLYKFMKSERGNPPVRVCTSRATYAEKFRMLPVILEDEENIDIDYELGVVGNIRLIESLFRFNELDVYTVLSGACSSLNKELVLWLKNKYDLTDLPSEDDLPLLKSCYVFLREDKSEEEKFDFVKFLDEHFTLDYVELTCDLSFTNHMSILRWCLSKQVAVSKEIFRIACRNSVEDMAYLDSLGHFRNNPVYYIDATCAGKVENLTWLEKRGLSFSVVLNNRPDINAYRVQGSIIPCLEWFVKKGIKIPSEALRESAYNRDMETFYWLLDGVDDHDKADLRQLSLWATYTEDFNLEIFTALLPYTDKERTREIIEAKKRTCSNYLLYEEAERRLLGC
ncbi:Ankyrin repeat-containing protein [Cedratvirus Zaza IHUMI]|uniref:Ankyrin repeat-containing protein n=1 Tax=Cedratvirus Zaza IHUMI TaxID=2126979 RepID=A0A2R8FFL3_9VIRU|nr:Ankyrin repeat-containing protein [Cedratvirus Zaza IHUMI]